MQTLDRIAGKCSIGANNFDLNCILCMHSNKTQTLLNGLLLMYLVIVAQYKIADLPFKATGGTPG